MSRPFLSRQRTVPAGIASRVAICGDESPSKYRALTTARNGGESSSTSSAMMPASSAACTTSSSSGEASGWPASRSRRARRTRLRSDIRCSLRRTRLHHPHRSTPASCSSARRKVFWTRSSGSPVDPANRTARRRSPDVCSEQSVTLDEPMRLLQCRRAPKRWVFRRREKKSFTRSDPPSAHSNNALSRRAYRLEQRGGCISYRARAPTNAA